MLGVTSLTMNSSVSIIFHVHTLFKTLVLKDPTIIFLIINAKCTSKLCKSNFLAVASDEPCKVHDLVSIARL